MAPRYTKRRFCGKTCSGKANSPFAEHLGPLNNRYNGGLSFYDGRWIISCRDGTLMHYYRGVMAAELGRLLRPDEIVHHINEDPSDDRVENLAVMTRAEHARLHHTGKKRGKG